MVANHAPDGLGHARPLVQVGSSLERLDLLGELNALVGRQLGNERDDVLNAGIGRHHGESVRQRRGDVEPTPVAGPGRGVDPG